MSNNHLQLGSQFFQGNQQQQLPYLNISRSERSEEGKQYQQEGLLPQQQSATGQQNKFYQEFRRIYSVSHHLQGEKERLTQVVSDLLERIRNVETRLNTGEIRQKEAKNVQQKEDNVSEENRAKRARRTAEQIQKKYKCQVAFCQRFYGSEGSLQQHIKIKHPHLLQRQSSDEYRPIAGKYDDEE